MARCASTQVWQQPHPKGLVDDSLEEHQVVDVVWGRGGLREGWVDEGLDGARRELD